MINTTKFTETIEREQVESITCDVCKKTYPNKGGNDYIEIQEFHHVDFIGGYGSVFGDETRVRCDICQHCLHGMIGGVIQGECSRVDYEKYVQRDFDTSSTGSACT